MSTLYDLYENPDIRQTGEKQPLRARIVSKGTIDQDEFLDRVSKFTGISRSLLSGAMQSFQNELRDLLAEGWNVELGGIGHFSASLQCPPVMTKKGYSIKWNRRLWSRRPKKREMLAHPTS